MAGCGGSGKSRLARELGTRLGIPPLHLDGPAASPARAPPK
jgi:adenylate kinase family enzyme